MYSNSSVHTYTYIYSVHTYTYIYIHLQQKQPQQQYPHNSYNTPSVDNSAQLQVAANFILAGAALMASGLLNRDLLLNNEQVCACVCVHVCVCMCVCRLLHRPCACWRDALLDRKKISGIKKNRLFYRPWRRLQGCTTRCECGQ